MTKLLKAFFASFKYTEPRKDSDFSDFFGMPASQKKKVIDQVLREANEEQRKVVSKYRKQLTGV